MTLPLAARTSSIGESPTLKVSARAKALARDGVDVVNFGAGEPDFDTPGAVCDAGIDAIRKGRTRYTPVTGIPELKQAVADKLRRDNGLEYDPSMIVVSCGAKHSLFNVIMSLVDPGDEVVIPSPYWVSYPAMVQYAGGTPVFVESSGASGFRIAPDALRAAISPRTKAVILNSPSNPTGAVYSADEMAAFAGVISHAGIWCLSDEIYEKLLYDGNSHVSIASLPGMMDLAVTVNGHSKAFAMTGWRIGYIASTSSSLVKAVGNLQSQSTSNPATPCQYAALAALSDPAMPDTVERMRSAFERRRNRIVELLNAVPGVKCPLPGGAFYVMPDVSSHYGRTVAGVQVADSMSFAGALLDKAHVAVVPGVAFGDDSCVRLSYACSIEQIEKGVAAMAAFLQES
ncbi:MAG: pyridoxal phosphate-dependent aminotransferase [Planctomycetes bacterium]|nr:pyridoxal phosphate-dependent aminotransferase [Planctomycetota bacterium]